MELTRLPNGSYAIDFDAFEAAITEKTRIFILCNPHNPVGRVFSQEELERLSAICLRHNVLICSDEIHGDLVYSGHRHIPVASLDNEIANRTITLMAPSKTFNIAGLDCSVAIIPNPEIRQRFKDARGGLVGGVNILGFTAALAAYQEGQPWLDDVLQYLEGNRDFLMHFVEEQLPGVEMGLPEGTYLAWLDCRNAGIETNPSSFFLENARVAMNDGGTFGQGGKGFVRLNFGCTRAMLAQALLGIRRSLEKVRDLQAA
jgi:cysteine-S-conjugate beta-lyase